MRRHELATVALGAFLLLAPYVVAGAVVGVGATTSVDRLGGTGHSAPTTQVVPVATHHSATGGHGVPRGAAAPVLTVVGGSPSAIGLSWTSAGLAGFTNYTITSSSVGASGPWQSVGIVGSQSTTTWSTASLTPGGSLWWQVTENGCFIGCTSSASNVVGFVQPTLAGLNFTLPTGSSADFNWTNNATYGPGFAFVSYGLYEKVGGGAPNLVASISTVSTHSFTVTGLSGGLGYTFYLNTTDCYSGCGSGSTLTAVSTSNAVTFGVPVALSASVSEVRAVIDVGQSDLFSCNPSGGRSPYTFAWDFGNGTTASGSASESQSYAAPGSPTVHCTVTDAAATQATSATTVTVNAAPDLNLTANASAVDVGQPLSLTGAPSLGTPTFALLWAFGDGGSASGPSVVHTWGASGHVVVTCSATDATTTTVVSTISLNVSPRLQVSSSTSSATAAPGTALTLTGEAHNGSGSFSRFAWTFGDGGQATGATVTHTYLGAGGFNATVLVTDSNGASNRSSVRITVSPIAVALGTLPASATTGQNLTFNASASGGAGGPYNYTWSFGDGTNGYGAVAAHRYTSPATYHPSVVVTDRLGGKNTSMPAPVAISNPPPAPPLIPLWALVVLLVVAALVVGLLIARKRRQKESAALRAAAPWAPPTDPSRTLLGRKNCPTCGASNLPIRETCESCGADLPRRSVHS